MRFSEGAAALVFSALCAMVRATGAEAEGTKIDCADTDFALKVPDFQLSCKDYSDPTAVSNAGKLGVELLEAISEKQEQYFAVWDIRAIGSIYLLRKGFEEDVHSNFPDEELAEWQTRSDEVAGFEYAEYVNRRSGSNEEECIAFRRQMTRRNGGYDNAGFGRIVIGFGCTTRERAVLIDSLKHLDAPGS